MICRRRSLREYWFVFNWLMEMDYDETMDHEFPLSLNQDRYVALNESGVLPFYPMENDNGVVFGCMTFVVTDHLKFRTRFAINDVQYIIPQYRGQGLFDRAFPLIESDLRNQGCTSVLMGYKEGHLHRNLERNGFVPYERVLEKKLT